MSESSERPSDAARQVTTRRQFVRGAARLGVGMAAGIALPEALAACATQSVKSSVPTATPDPTATATPETRPVTIAITGDVMLGRSVNQRILQTNDRFPFNDTADWLSGFELTIGNLECVVSTLGRPQPKQYTFEGNPRGFGRLVAAGYDIVSVANNHSGDYGTDAFVDMLDALPTHGITPLGGGLNLAQAHAPVIRHVRSTRLGFLAYCEIEPQSFAATQTTPGHAWLDPALVAADIRALRPQVDYLLVFTHWGIEYHPIPSGEQQAMAQLAIDSGADFVVGAHPHIIQPFSTYRGKPIVYSLGNFVFDEMYSEDVRRGNVLTLTVQGKSLLNWSLRTARIGDYGAPVWVSGS